MYEYRVTKYNPEYRVNGSYVREEWTSMAEVGTSFEGQLFTIEAYEEAEQKHIDFLCRLAEMCGVCQLEINSLEVNERVTWQDGQCINLAQLKDVARKVLREECWCRLTAPSFFIHFGYDYYMYVGCDLPIAETERIAAAYDLFCEEMVSPYHDEEESPCSSVP